MGTFSGLAVGLSGLEASQESLDVIGQNVTNANTPGYVRERADLQAVGGVEYPGFDQPVTPSPGSGVQVTSVERLNDTFLQARSLDEHAANGSLTSQLSALQAVQANFPEPSSNGISQQLTDYWNAWDAVANSPGDSAARTALLDKGQALASSLNQAAAGVATVESDTTAQLSAAVSTVNALTGEIASLNKSIEQGTNAKLPVNELQDQRDQLLSQLSDQLSIRTVQNANGTVNVYSGTGSLVDGVDSRSVAVAGTGASTSLVWSSDGSAFGGSGGQVGGMLTLLGATLPGYQASLDKVAASLAGVVNNGQAQGVTTSGAPGQPFFAGTTAATISVALTSPDQVAAASATAPAPSTGQNLDGSNAAAIGELANASTVTLTGGSTVTAPDAAYSDFVTGLGSDVARVTTQQAGQGQAMDAADTALKNQTGVNVDEELTAMVQYQNSYAAAAKYINAVDTTLQTLISDIN